MHLTKSPLMTSTSLQGNAKAGKVQTVQLQTVNCNHQTSNSNPKKLIMLETKFSNTGQRSNNIKFKQDQYYL